MAGARIKDKIKCVLKSFNPDAIVLSHFFECVCMYVFMYVCMYIYIYTYLDKGFHKIAPNMFDRHTFSAYYPLSLADQI